MHPACYVPILFTTQEVKEGGPNHHPSVHTDLVCEMHTVPSSHSEYVAMWEVCLAMRLANLQLLFIFNCKLVLVVSNCIIVPSTLYFQ